MAAAVYKVTPTRVFCFKWQSTNQNKVQTVQIRHSEVNKHLGELIDPPKGTTKQKIIGYITGSYSHPEDIIPVGNANIVVSQDSPQAASEKGLPGLAVGQAVSPKSVTGKAAPPVQAKPAPEQPAPQPQKAPEHQLSKDHPFAGKWLDKQTAAFMQLQKKYDEDSVALGLSGYGVNALAKDLGIEGQGDELMLQFKNYLEAVFGAQGYQDLKGTLKKIKGEYPKIGDVALQYLKAKYGDSWSSKSPLLTDLANKVQEANLAKEAEAQKAAAQKEALPKPIDKHAGVHSEVEPILGMYHIDPMSDLAHALNIRYLGIATSKQFYQNNHIPVVGTKADLEKLDGGKYEGIVDRLFQDGLLVADTAGFHTRFYPEPLPDTFKTPADITIAPNSRLDKVLRCFNDDPKPKSYWQLKDSMEAAGAPSYLMSQMVASGYLGIVNGDQVGANFSYEKAYDVWKGIRNQDHSKFAETFQDLVPYLEDKLDDYNPDLDHDYYASKSGIISTLGYLYSFAPYIYPGILQDLIADNSGIDQYEANLLYHKMVQDGYLIKGSDSSVMTMFGLLKTQAEAEAKKAAEEEPDPVKEEPTPTPVEAPVAPVAPLTQNSASKITTYPKDMLLPFHPEDYVILDNLMYLRKHLIATKSVYYANQQTKKIMAYMDAKYGFDTKQKLDEIGDKLQSYYSQTNKAGKVSSGKHNYYKKKKEVLAQMVKAYGQDWYINHPSIQAALGNVPIINHATPVEDATPKGYQEYVQFKTALETDLKTKLSDDEVLAFVAKGQGSPSAKNWVSALLGKYNATSYPIALSVASDELYDVVGNYLSNGENFDAYLFNKTPDLEDIFVNGGVGYEEAEPTAPPSPETSDISAKLFTPEMLKGIAPLTADEFTLLTQAALGGWDGLNIEDDLKKPVLDALYKQALSKKPDMEVGGSNFENSMYKSIQSLKTNNEIMWGDNLDPAVAEISKVYHGASNHPVLKSILDKIEAEKVGKQQSPVETDQPIISKSIAKSMVHPLHPDDAVILTAPIFQDLEAEGYDVPISAINKAVADKYGDEDAAYGAASPASKAEDDYAAIKAHYGKISEYPLIKAAIEKAGLTKKPYLGAGTKGSYVASTVQHSYVGIPSAADMTDAKKPFRTAFFKESQNIEYVPDGWHPDLFALWAMRHKIANKLSGNGADVYSILMDELDVIKGSDSVNKLASYHSLPDEELEKLSDDFNAAFDNGSTHPVLRKALDHAGISVSLKDTLLSKLNPIDAPLPDTFHYPSQVFQAYLDGYHEMEIPEDHKLFLYGADAKVLGTSDINELIAKFLSKGGSPEEFIALAFPSEVLDTGTGFIASLNHPAYKALIDKLSVWFSKEFLEAISSSVDAPAVGSTLNSQAAETSIVKALKAMSGGDWSPVKSAPVTSNPKPAKPVATLSTEDLLKMSSANEVLKAYKEGTYKSGIDLESMFAQSLDFKNFDKGILNKYPPEALIVAAYPTSTASYLSKKYGIEGDITVTAAMKKYFGFSTGDLEYVYDHMMLTNSAEAVANLDPTFEKALAAQLGMTTWTAKQESTPGVWNTPEEVLADYKSGKATSEGFLKLYKEHLNPDLLNSLGDIPIEISIVRRNQGLLKNQGLIHGYFHTQMDEEFKGLEDLAELGISNFEDGLISNEPDTYSKVVLAAFNSPVVQAFLHKHGLTSVEWEPVQKPESAEIHKDAPVGLSTQEVLDNYSSGVASDFDSESMPATGYSNAWIGQGLPKEALVLLTTAPSDAGVENYYNFKSWLLKRPEILSFLQTYGGISKYNQYLPNLANMAWDGYGQAVLKHIGMLPKDPQNKSHTPAAASTDDPQKASWKTPEDVFDAYSNGYSELDPEDKDVKTIKYSSTNPDFVDSWPLSMEALVLAAYPAYVWGKWTSKDSDDYPGGSDQTTGEFEAAVVAKLSDIFPDAATQIEKANFGLTFSYSDPLLQKIADTSLVKAVMASLSGDASVDLGIPKDSKVSDGSPVHSSTANTAPASGLQKLKELFPDTVKPSSLKYSEVPVEDLALLYLKSAMPSTGQYTSIKNNLFYKYNLSNWPVFTGATPSIQEVESALKQTYGDDYLKNHPSTKQFFKDSPDLPDSEVVWGKSPTGVTSLNGTPLTAVTPGFWDQHEDVILDLKDPVQNKMHLIKKSGLVVVEPDGRVWIVEPTNHYAGSEHTWPKGEVDTGLTHQQNALKEAYEESGLQCQILDHLGDYANEGSAEYTRYYIAKRIGGAPWSTDSETANVKLVPTEKALQMLNKTRDKKVLEQLKNIISKTPGGVAEILSKTPVTPSGAAGAPTPVVSKYVAGPNYSPDSFKPIFASKLPDPASLKLHSDASKLGGVHGHLNKIYTDPNGNKYLFKPAVDVGGSSKPYAAYAAQAFSQMAHLVKGSHVPVLKTTIEGTAGTLQPLKDVQSKKDLEGYKPSDLTESEKEDVASEQLLDWLLSEFDTKGSNFIRAADGHVYGIDKDQGFKFFSTDNLSTEYQPDSESLPYYNTFWNAFAENKLDFDPKILGKYVDKIDAIPFAHFEDAVRPYAVTFFKDKAVHLDKFYERLRNRKNTLRQNFEKFITKQYKTRTGKEGKFTFKHGWDAGVGVGKTKKVTCSAAQLLSNIDGYVRQCKDSNGATIPDKIYIKIFQHKDPDGSKLKGLFAKLGLPEPHIEKGTETFKTTISKSVWDAATVELEEHEAPQAYQSQAGDISPTPHKPDYLPEITHNKLVEPNHKDAGKITSTPWSGKHIYTDGPLVEGHVMKVRPVVKNGVTSYVYTFKIKDSKQFTGGVGSTFQRPVLSYDAASGVFKHTKDIASQAASMSSTKWVDGDSELHLLTSNEDFAFHNMAYAKVRPVVGESHDQAFRRLMAKANPAFAKTLLTDPTPADLEMIKLRKLLWAIDPAAERGIVSSGVAPTAAKLRTLLHNAGVTEAEIESVKAVETTPGHVTHVLPGRWKKPKTKSGERALNYFYVNMTSMEVTGKVFRAGMLASIVDRALSGQDILGSTSVHKDISSGGADSLFVHVSTVRRDNSSIDEGICSNGVSLMLLPDEMDRLDSYTLNGDGYGCTRPTGDSSSHYWNDRKSMETRIGEYASGQHYDYEVLFRSGIPTTRVARILCTSEYKRKDVIQQLRKEGFEEINSVPIEDFVVHCDSQKEAYEKYIKPMGF